MGSVCGYAVHTTHKFSLDFFIPILHSWWRVQFSLELRNLFKYNLRNRWYTTP